MKLDVQNILDYAGNNFAERKFIEGQRVLWKGSVIKCGKILDGTTGDPNLVKIYALCTQTSHINEAPFIVTGEVQKDGKIINFVCTCPAGSSEQCKHVIATILNCFFTGTDLPTLSSTDLACSWSKIRGETLKNYKAMPIDDHPCWWGPNPELKKKSKKIFRRSRKHNKKLINSPNKTKKVLGDSDILNATDSAQGSGSPSSLQVIENVSAQSSACPEEIQLNISNHVSNGKKRKERGDCGSDTYIVASVKKCKGMPSFSESQVTNMLDFKKDVSASGLMKEMVGRHSEILVEQFSKVSAYDKQIYKVILDNQKSNLLESIDLYPVKPFAVCCESVIANLNVDPLLICENTRNYFAEWFKERKYRVTGTSGYALYTYCQNSHEPNDWKKKIENFVSPKDFSTESTEYGLKNEAPAREVFKMKNPQYEVIETGLIVCKQLPWLSCSPDGVIIFEGKPVSLLEIKCFAKGKTAGIEAVVESKLGKGGCLKMKDNVVVLREKNKYYGQVQLGMALLNVENCKFVLYSAFDKNIFTVDVAKDVLFLRKMLTRLKRVYYANILPEICYSESANQDVSLHADRSHLIVDSENMKPMKPKKSKISQVRA